MNRRQDRRVARKDLPRVVRESRAWRRFVKNISEHGEVANRFYRMDAEGDLVAAYFDIFSLIQHARQHCELVYTHYDWDRLAKLLEGDAIDEDHLRNHTMHIKPEPIILCQDGGGPGRDQIVDGAHRYVAWGLAARQNNTLNFTVPTYLAKPEDWRPFVIPVLMAKHLRLHEG